MPEGALSANQYLNYINEYRPEVGSVDSPGFFYDLFNQYLPDRRWPDNPDKRVMSAGWMYDAGIVIAQGEDRVDDMLNALRLTEPLDMQTSTLLTVADEEERPELLEEALARWDEFVGEVEHEEDFDPSYTYEHICMLAAKFKQTELFEEALGRIPDEHHPGVLTEAAKYGDESYVERAIKQLSSLEHTNEADDYDVSVNILDHALNTGNYSTAVLAIGMSSEILFEAGFFDYVVNIAAGNEELEELRKAVDKNAFGIHRYEFAIRMAKLGDEASSLMAADSLRGIARTRDADGDSVLYHSTKEIAESSEQFEPETQQKVKNKITEFLDEVFTEAYSGTDFITAHNAALGYLKVTKSFEYFDRLLSEKAEEVVREIANTLVGEGSWGIYGPTALMISIIEQGERGLVTQSLLKGYLRSGKEPFAYKNIEEDSADMSAEELITEDQYNKLKEFLARDI